MTLTFNFRGRQVSAAEFSAASAQPKKRTPKEGPGAYHRGYRVVGHAPGAVAAAEKLNASEIVRWREASAKQRAEYGMREPPVWDEASWRLRAPKKTIKGVDLYASALEASELARKAGWTEVDVIELKKGSELDARNALV